MACKNSKLNCDKTCQSYLKNNKKQVIVKKKSVMFHVLLSFDFLIKYLSMVYGNPKGLKLQMNFLFTLIDTLFMLWEMINEAADVAVDE